jgi:hypothetical protein
MRNCDPRKAIASWASLASAVLAFTHCGSYRPTSGQPLLDSGVEGADAGRSGDGGAIVMGRVLDATTRKPLPGRLVVIGQDAATTDANGEFTIEVAGSTYDVIVVDPDGTAVSVYLGVSRRDLVLSHEPSAVPDPWTQSARVTGNLLGGGPYPMSSGDSVALYFFSKEVTVTDLLAGSLGSPFDGPTYGPMNLFWNGPSSITGHVVALGSFGHEAGAAKPWFVDQVDSLADGDEASVDLPLAPVEFGRISGSIQVAPGYSVGFRQAGYRLPGSEASVNVVNEKSTSSSFDYTIPDLRSLGGRLCVNAGSAQDPIRVVRCGIDLGASDITLALRPPPALMEPAAGASVSNDTPFSWTALDGGIYELAFESDDPQPDSPNIHIFTASITARRPSLVAAGVPPSRLSAYRWKVGSLGTYGSMDEALGPSGIAADFSGERWVSFSPAVEVTLLP